MTFTEIAQVAAARTLPADSATLVPPAVAETVPEPQVVDAFGAAATVTPPGSASLTVRPVSATAPAAVFATVIVSVEVPFAEIEPGANALESVTFGARTTVSTALAAAPLVAPCVLVSAPAGMVLVYAPTTELVTFTVIVQVADAPTLPPLSATLEPPAVAETLPLPHVVEAFGVAAMATFAGRASASAMPRSATAPLAVLATVIVSVETPVGAIVAGLKALLSVTFGTETVSVAVAGVLLVAPCALVTAFAGIVLTWLPDATPLTVTLTVQVAPAATAPPVSATLVAPEAAVTEPLPHVVEAFGVAATSTPLGNASVTARLVSAAAPVAVLAIVICRTEVPSSEIAAGVKALVSVTGGASCTTSVAVAGAAFVAPSVLETPPAGIELT